MTKYFATITGLVLLLPARGGRKDGSSLCDKVVSSVDIVQSASWECNALKLRPVQITINYTLISRTLGGSNDHWIPMDLRGLLG